MTKIKWLKSKKIKRWFVSWNSLLVSVIDHPTARKEEITYPFKKKFEANIERIGVVEIETNGEKYLGSLIVYKPIKDKK